jgi:DegV family protein with EDD domain
MKKISFKYVDGKRFRRMIIAASHWLRQSKDHLNDINVFPVPDGDTGNNMVHTMDSAAEGLVEIKEKSISVVADKLADSTLFGARGNSGVILSQFFRGFAEAVQDKRRLYAHDLVESLKKASEKAKEAVGNPTEGTILTVMRESFDWDIKEKLTEKGHDLRDVMDEIIHRAKVSLENTPNLLPTLKKAGVVDAGAEGFVRMLEGMRDFIERGRLDNFMDKVRKVSTRVAEKVNISHENPEFQYCTEFILSGENINLNELKETAKSLGNSVVVVGGRKVARVHVHTNNPEKVFEEASIWGEVREKKIDDMWAQQQKFLKKPVVIVTDSSSDIDADLAAQMNIIVVPLEVTFGDNSYRDGIDLTPREFFDKLESFDGIPKTSMPTRYSFIESYKRAIEDAENVISVHISEEMSGTINLARSVLAELREEVDGEYEVIDSRATSMLLGLPVIRGAQKVKAGKSYQEVVQSIKKSIQEVKGFMIMDTLKYASKCGRVSNAKAFLGSVLHIKSLLTADGKGSLHVPYKVIGWKRVVKLLKEKMMEYAIPLREYDVAIAHTQNLEEATSLKKWVEENIKARNIYITEIGTTIGTSGGPGMLGLFLNPVF